MRVSAELHDEVVLRDGECFVAKLARDTGNSHICTGKYGIEDIHKSTDLARLTVDHVHSAYGMLGKRAPDTIESLIAMCHGANVNGPERTSKLTWRQVRAAERDYLNTLYADSEHIQAS